MADGVLRPWDVYEMKIMEYGASTRFRDLFLAFELTFCAYFRTLAGAVAALVFDTLVCLEDELNLVWDRSVDTHPIGTLAILIFFEKKASTTNDAAPVLLLSVHNVGCSDVSSGASKASLLPLILVSKSKFSPHLLFPLDSPCITRRLRILVSWANYRVAKSIASDVARRYD
jgi:hypothetical protein